MLELLTNPVLEIVSRQCGVAVDTLANLLSTPAKGVAADVALPCFQIAKQKGAPPPKIAAELADAVNASGAASAAAVGPFLNLTFAPEAVAQALMGKLSADPAQALRSAVGSDKTVCIDFSSPNIAKQLAFHHIRGTMLGNALSRCYQAAGYNVKRLNFLGDWGTSFGRLIAGWKRENLTLELLDSAPDKVAFLNDLYVRISRAAKDDPKVEEEARFWSKKIEDGDQDARHLWQIFRDASIDEFKKAYALLDVQFDDWNGEAFYADKISPIERELEQKGLTTIDQGATVVDLTSLGFKKPALIKRSDGGSLYAGRDIAACDDRFQKYRFDRSLYVVDLGQALHFKEWFAVAKLLGRTYVEDLRHIGYGLVLMWSDENQSWEKTATRKGVPLMLMDVLAEAQERALAIMREKNPDLPADEAKAVARMVGVGAVVFNDLKGGRNHDVKFKLDDALNMQGETGPYLQFAHARLCSIERKFVEMHPAAPKADYKLLNRADEKNVLLGVARMRSALERTVETDEPSVLASALLSLAAAISAWLTAGNHDVHLRVLCPDVATASARLALVSCARAVIGEGLRLLGLRAPHRM
jgi:arginyl-tRNA synthetase